MRKRKIIKVGGSLDIRLQPADHTDLDLNEGDLVSIDDIVKVKDEE